MRRTTKFSLLAARDLLRVILRRLNDIDVRPPRRLDLRYHLLLVHTTNLVLLPRNIRRTSKDHVPKRRRLRRLIRRVTRTRGVRLNRATEDSVWTVRARMKGPTLVGNVNAANQRSRVLPGRNHQRIQLHRHRKLPNDATPRHHRTNHMILSLFRHHRRHNVRTNEPIVTLHRTTRCIVNSLLLMTLRHTTRTNTVTQSCNLRRLGRQQKDLLPVVRVKRVRPLKKNDRHRVNVVPLLRALTRNIAKRHRTSVPRLLPLQLKRCANPVKVNQRRTLIRPRRGCHPKDNRTRPINCPRHRHVRTIESNARVCRPTRRRGRIFRP